VTRTSRSKEYSELREFALALAEFLDRRQPGAARLSLADSLADGFTGNEEHLSRSRQLQGARMAVGDLLEMTRGVGTEVVRETDAWLTAKGVFPLSAMRERIWRQVPKILARGRIRNDSEYYLLIERLNDAGATGLQGPDRTRAAEIVAAYAGKRAV
jgi:hypothetical protein